LYVYMYVVLVKILVQLDSGQGKARGLLAVILQIRVWNSVWA
jgi:hypothetical protein